MKWLAAGAIVVAALAVALWFQLRAPAEAAVVPAAHVTPPAAAPAAAPAGLAQAVQKVAAAGSDGKIDPASDEFFYKFDDLQPSMLTRNAASCYVGGLHRVHRNQMLKLHFHNKIKDGEVTVYGVEVDKDSTITDPVLVDCFVKRVSETHWHDAALPDWDQPDELVIRPERGMKKFTKENVEYEGDGPDYTKVHPNSATAPSGQ